MIGIRMFGLIKAPTSWTNAAALLVMLMTLQGCLSSAQLHKVVLGRTVASFDGFVQSPWTFVENDIGITLGIHGDRPMFEVRNNSTHNAVISIDSSFFVLNQLPFALRSCADCSLTGTTVLPPTATLNLNLARLLTCCRWRMSTSNPFLKMGATKRGFSMRKIHPFNFG